MTDQSVNNNSIVYLSETLIDAGMVSKTIFIRSYKIVNIMDDTSAAIFDFDGVIFHRDAKWKISDLRLGVKGSRISFHDALNLFKEYRKDKPDVLLTDCFTLDEFVYNKLDKSAMNFTPPELVAQTAQSHVFKGHDLYFLSFSKHRELSVITDRIAGELKYPVIKNPFHEARHLFPDVDYYDGIQDEKLTLIIELLRRKDRFYSRNMDDKVPYTRIYYYYTDKIIFQKLKKFLQANFENFEGGRNCITFNYIASIKA